MTALFIYLALKRGVSKKIHIMVSLFKNVKYIFIFKNKLI